MCYQYSLEERKSALRNGLCREQRLFLEAWTTCRDEGGMVAKEDTVGCTVWLPVQLGEGFAVNA
jgi:hypothetical protein